MEKTTTGIQENVSSLLCYLFGWISGLVFFLIEKENKTVRFHALQSLIVFGALTLAQIVTFPLLFIPFLGRLLNFCIAVITLGLWIILMIKAYQGEKFRVPIAADIADKNV